MQTIPALTPSRLCKRTSGDPASAARLARNDFYRLERALEVVQVTGRPMQDFLPTEGSAAPFEFRHARPGRHPVPD